MTHLKSLILCADDFGFSPGISEGILKLAGAERLSAISCMVNLPSFKNFVQDLLSLKNTVQVGLHFNLTEGYLLASALKNGFCFKTLLIKAHLGLINCQLIKEEFNLQLDRFLSLTGRFPDFIDGHQHIHQFPIIRQALLETYQQRLSSHQLFIRSTYPLISLPQYPLKSKLISITGAKALHGHLGRLKIPHNPYFAGVYDFSPRFSYRDLFQQWLRLAPTNTLIMCHPGEGLLDKDPIAEARVKEFTYFSSDLFIEDCETYQVTFKKEHFKKDKQTQAVGMPNI